MSTLNSTGEVRKPEFIEEDYISAIETAINRSYYFQNKFVEIRRISQADENDLGYDGVLTTLVPFYIQFKRSYFYSPRFTGNLLTQRSSCGLPTDKGFFAFELLRKHKRYWQHNTLYKLSQRSKAAYVAPMFYKSSDLSFLKTFGTQALPIHYDDIIFHHPSVRLNVNIKNVYLFKRSITIPPHALIRDRRASHHYSYCRENRCGFHTDPINLENSGAQNLYYFLREIFERTREASNKSPVDQIDQNYELLPELFGLDNTSEEFRDIIVNSIRRISNTFDVADMDNLIAGLDVVDKLMILEDVLYQYFNIRQLVSYELR